MLFLDQNTYLQQIRDCQGVNRGYHKVQLKREMLSDIVWNRIDTDGEQKIYEEKNINA